MCVCVCVCVCVSVCCSDDADGCIPLTMLVDSCPNCRLLMFIIFMVTAFRDTFDKMRLSSLFFCLFFF